MPGLSVTTTQTTEVKLAPKMKRVLLTTLRAYGELKVQRDAIDRAMKAHKETLSGVLDETGEASIAIEGYRTTLVAPVRKVLDPKRLIALGVDPEVIKQATVETPTTPYIKVSVPGAADNER